MLIPVSSHDNRIIITIILDKIQDYLQFNRPEVITTVIQMGIDVIKYTVRTFMKGLDPGSSPIMVVPIKFTDLIRCIGKPECAPINYGNGILQIENSCLLIVAVAALAATERFVTSAPAHDVIPLDPGAFLHAHHHRAMIIYHCTAGIATILPYVFVFIFSHVHGPDVERHDIHRWAAVSSYIT